jgi:hypothetical protein
MGVLGFVFAADETAAGVIIPALYGAFASFGFGLGVGWGHGGLGLPFVWSRTTCTFHKVSRRTIGRARRFLTFPWWLLLHFI